jgi:hypothetical protein
MSEPILMKLGMYTMAPSPISMAYFINRSISLCLYVYLPIVIRQQPGKNVTAATKTQATMQELLGTSFSMLSV